MLVPLKLEISYTRYPITNIILIAAMIIIEVLFLSMSIPLEQFERFILQGWNLEGLIGHMFIHADLAHLLGNMIFLWVFGNAICATIGNIAYPILYVVLGIAAASAHLLFGGGPAVGASGAINGIIGMALIWYPKNNLKFFYAFFWVFAGGFKIGRFEIKSFWMILLWFVFDVFGAIAGQGNIAYLAHIGGFAGGMIIAYILLLLNVVETYSPTYKDLVTEKEPRHNKNKPMESLFPFEEKESGLKDASHLKTNMNFEEMKLEEEAKHILSGNVDATPEFKILKTIPAPGTVTGFYVNKGDRISNISIEPLGNFQIEISPSEIIEAGDSGAIKITNIQESANEYKFKLGFSKPDSTRKFMEFRFSVLENKITAIDNPDPGRF